MGCERNLPTGAASRALQARRGRPSRASNGSSSDELGLGRIVEFWGSEEDNEGESDVGRVGGPMGLRKR